jgi:hypothetical protein
MKLLSWKKVAVTNTKYTGDLIHDLLPVSYSKPSAYQTFPGNVYYIVDITPRNICYIVNLSTDTLLYNKYSPRGKLTI